MKEGLIKLIDSFQNIMGRLKLIYKKLGKNYSENG